MVAAEKKDLAQTLARRLRDMAEERAKWVSAGRTGEYRDGLADAVAELAELIATLDFRQMS